jgi:hypothetical protein
MKKDNKQRLFEMMGKLDSSFKGKTKLNERYGSKYDYEDLYSDEPKDDNFVTHGTYTVSNVGGYEIMLNDAGDAARVRDAFGSDEPKTSDWLEIEYIPSEDDGEMEPVIDPNGYNIPLNMVMKSGVNEEVKLNEQQTRSLSEIAREIKRDWGNKVNYAAKPYLDAMMTLDSIDDNYMFDSGRSIVAYFLSNAGSWKGETAKRIKKELKGMLNLKEENIPQENDGEILNESSSKSPINKFVYFGFNYPQDFIQQIWGDDSLANHIQTKFDKYYDTVGAAGVMNRFYVELDSENQRKLEDWIIQNYKG